MNRPVVPRVTYEEPAIALALRAKAPESLRELDKPQYPGWLRRRVLEACQHAYDYQGDLERRHRQLKQWRRSVKAFRTWAQRKLRGIPDEALRPALDAFEEALEAHILGFRHSVSVASYQSGALLYLARLDTRHTLPQNPALNGLMFELAYLFRYATNKKGSGQPAHRGPMPKFGRPNLKFVSALCRGTLREDYTPNQIGVRLYQLTAEGVQLTLWAT